MRPAVLPPEYEIELLSQVREGDVRAFEYLYHAYCGMLLGCINRIVKSDVVAEEVLQETFQRVWEHRQNLDAGKSFKSYLFTIARNLVFNYFNRTSRERLLEQYLAAKEKQLPADISHLRLEEKESELLLERAVGQLPPQRKLVYTLCKIEGKSYEDVSRALGISVSTISDHIVKATKSIKIYYLSRALFISCLFMMC